MLQHDKDAMIVFDDGIWEYQHNAMLTLWQLAHTRCQIIITADSLGDLLGIPEKEITSDMRRDIERYWEIIQMPTPAS